MQSAVQKSKQPKRSKAQKRQYSQAFPNGRKNQNPRPAKRQRRRRRQDRSVANLGSAISSLHLNARGETRNTQTNRQRMVIEEDEYIADVVVANQPGFNNVQYSVNPGQGLTFPWLAQVAQRFEKYRFLYLEFYYKRIVSEFAVSGQTGKIILSFDTDAADGPPTTKQQMEDTEPHVDFMPSENGCLDINRQYLISQMDAHYVRTGGIPAGTDIKTYDVGNLNIATTGIASNVAVGELHVRYRVELTIPILGNPLLAFPKSSAYFQSTATQAAPVSGVGATLLMGTTSMNALGVTGAGTGLFTPPPGNYLITGGVEVQCTLADLISIHMDILKNGFSIYNSVSPFITTGSTSEYINGTVLVQCSGTDVISLFMTAAYTGGTTSFAGTLCITSV